MRNAAIAGLTFVLAIGIACSPGGQAGPKGHLFIVGAAIATSL